MTWVKLDEDFTQHPKVLVAGPLAGWLHVCGLSYCNRFLTDGRIPKAAVTGLVEWRGHGVFVDTKDGDTIGVDSPDNRALAAELVRVGMWIDDGQFFCIHDYLVYQPSRDEVLASREARKKAGVKGGKASGEARKTKYEANSEANAQANSEAKDQRKSNDSRSKTEAKVNPVSDPVSDPEISLSRAKAPDQIWLDVVGVFPGASLYDAWMLAAKAAPAKGLSPEEYFSKALGVFTAWVDGVRADRRPQKSPQKFIEHFARIQEILDGKREAVPAETPLPPRDREPAQRTYEDFGDTVKRIEGGES